MFCTARYIPSTLSIGPSLHHCFLPLSLSLSSNSLSPPVYSFFHHSNCPSFLFLSCYVIFFLSFWDFVLFLLHLIWLSLSQPPLFNLVIYLFIDLFYSSFYFFHLSNLTILFSFLFSIHWFISSDHFFYSLFDFLSNYRLLKLFQQQDLDRLKTPQSVGIPCDWN